MKRKQFEVMKNDLRVELTKLTIDSGKLNIDIQEAKLDFEMMCKAMADRQAEFMSSALFLEEKYGGSIAVLEGKVIDGDGEGSSENVVLPRSYEGSIKRFVEDSGDSLYHHGVLRTAEIKEIGDMFEKYIAIWNQNMKEMKEMAQRIEKQRVKLDIKLTNFNQAVLSDDEEYEEDDEEEPEEEDEEEPEEEDEEEHDDEEDN